MWKRWQSERRKDYYYKKAKAEDYRSRAAYKLKQINDRFNIIKYGDVIIDLGANPGGWSQVASEIAGSGGLVISLDIKPISPMNGVIVLRGDARKPETMEKVREALGEREVDVIISDMSPNISGNYSTDHARSIELAEMAFEFSRKFLRKGGNFAVKVFDGDMTKGYFDLLARSFRVVKRHSPKASRSSSSELYVIAKGFKGTYSE